ncbi:ciliary microtubule inner protein 2B [Anabrus simplex]|uniref:ciliary microtubule inner protein 2B n=1 Tax=Anabrus simplex TaxID=316456 RepID=UPI0035A3736D
MAPSERSILLSQNQPCLIPGYTGHCPSLKFRVGKRYGANTNEIIKEYRDKGVSIRHEPYRQGEAYKKVLTPIERKEGQTEDYALDVKYRCRPYILGYTGYIPGMVFRYGMSFRRAADDSVTEFSRRMSQEEARRERERLARSRSAPKMPSIRSRDQVRTSLKHYDNHAALTDSHISPDFPPIAGYTGHIPRLRVTDASLSQRYNIAARQGLAMLQKEREKRRGVHSANDAVRTALNKSEDRYTTPAM